jgi:hypothetical protein
MYVDNTSNLDFDSDLEVLMTRVSMELRKMSLWFHCNKIPLNKNKTKFNVPPLPPPLFLNRVKHTLTPKAHKLFPLSSALLHQHIQLHLINKH